MQAQATTPDTSRTARDASTGKPSQMISNDQLRPLLVSIAEAQRLLGGIGKTAFYSAKDRYGMRLVHLGGRSMVPVSEIERVIAELMALEPETPPKVVAATAASLASRRVTPSRRRRRGTSPP